MEVFASTPRLDRTCHQPTTIDILEDSPLTRNGIAEADADSSIDSTPDRNPTSTAYIRALQETCVNIVPSHKGTESPTEHQTPLFDASPTSLTIQFGRLRIASLETPKDPSERGQASESPSPVLSKRLPLRPALAVETFDPPAEPQPVIEPELLGSPSIEGDTSLGPIEFLAPITEEAVSDPVIETRDSGVSFQDHPLMQLPACLPSVEDQAAKLQAGQYEYSIAYPQTVQASLDIVPDENEEPTHASDKTRIVYGCNPARRNAVSKTASLQGIHLTNTITMIASPLTHEIASQGEPKVLVDQVGASAAEMGETLSSPATPLANGRNGTGPAATQRPISVNGFTRSVTSSPAAPKILSIEDSLEALDRLEEELEAVNAVTHFGRVPSPEIPPLGRSPGRSPAQLQRAGSRAAHTPASANRPRSSLYAATVRIKPTDPGRAGPYRSRSMSVGAEEGEAPAAAKAEGVSESPARRPVARPASLAPPKPLVKSNKPRTMPTFELPGEAIARKLKEKKEARLSMQLEVGKSPAAAIKAATPQRTRSTRLLPRPTFELPGEAISRRKREQREAQIRAQEEEEQRRREFKARPIMAGLRQPSSAPRETVASRARQTKVSQMENGAAMSASMKRLSLAATQSPLVASSQSRGRAVATSPSQLSRATSVAASSVSGSGKRSTISAEDAAQHKVRGKEILARDNRYANDRERGRAEREVLAKLAREQAAERSRQLSREWAEKQRRKAANASAGTAALTR